MLLDLNLAYMKRCSVCLHLPVPARVTVLKSALQAPGKS